MSRAVAVVQKLDHLVLTCANISATTQWYQRYLGMRVETFTPPSDPSTQRVALRFGTQKINLHQQGKEFEPKAKTALPGSADLCFLIQDDADLEDLISHFKENSVGVLEGEKAVMRTGATGKIRSIYVRDPDGNLIELSQYLESKA